MSLGVHSETGRLRQVIVHRPGLELARLTPQNIGSLLFDVEGQGALTAYLRELYGKRLSVSARKGGAPKLLALSP